MIIFEVADKLKRKIKFTNERKEHIAIRHPEITEFNIFESVLKEPNLIKTSTYDDNVLLYYKNIGGGYQYFVVVVKLLNGEGFVLTAYKTNIIKGGRVIWKS